MISKNKVKFIKSLQIKKFRSEYKQFLVEGAKSTLELIQSDYTITELIVTNDFLSKNSAILKANKSLITEVTEKELSSLSNFNSNNAALAVVEMKKNEPLYAEKDEYVLLLDRIQDPGNLGTIVRIADWYGIKKIICSSDTADFYNPKTIAATMGSFCRVLTYYTPLASFLKTNKMSVYAADLQGSDVHSFSFANEGYLLMGNESEGISEELRPYLKNYINIPSYGQAESLNVAIATAIICDNIYRMKKNKSTIIPNL